MIAFDRNLSEMKFMVIFVTHFFLLEAASYQTFIPYRSVEVKTEGDTLVTDIDGDGLVDKLITKEDGTKICLKNLGLGEYIDVIVKAEHFSDQHGYSPANPDSQYFVDETADRLPDNAQLSSASDVGDVDGDGDMDILVGNGPFGPGFSGIDRLLINDGTGHFSDETEERLPLKNLETRGVTLGDIDNDHDLDIILSVNPVADTSGQDRIYINNGSGFFTDETHLRLPIDPVRSKSATLCDIDGDGDFDILFAKGFDESNRVYLNDGSGYFTDATAELFPPGSDTLNTFKILPVDVEGDFDLDLVLVNFLGENAERQNEILWRNGGDGYYIQEHDIFPNNPDDAGLGGDIFEFSSDHLGDVVIAKVFQNSLYFSDGVGGYTDQTDLRLPPNDRTSALMVGDVDGDGNADIFCANGTYDDQLFLNSGENIFLDVTTEYLPSISSSSSRSAELADFDGDGDLDIFTACTGDGQNRLLINNGNVADTIPTTIHYDAENSIAGDNTIRIFVQDNMRCMDTVGIWIRTVEDTSFVFDEMKPVGGDLYQTDLWDYSGHEVDFYFQVIDRNQNVAILPPEAPDSMFTTTLLGIDATGTELPSLQPLVVGGYPNPFNQKVVFDISIPGIWQCSRVSITAYNLKGEQVGVILEGVIALGMDQVVWDAGGIASGTYLVYFVIENSSFEVYRKTQKVVLIK